MPSIVTPRHSKTRRANPALAVALVLASCATALLLARDQGDQEQKEGFRFRSGVDVINVTATVTDASGRFVRGLLRDDFTILEDGRPQPITHFSAERVPVSLGIAIDTSGSMAGEKWTAARDALNRFLYELLDPQDEVFLYKFNDAPDLLQGWTTDRELISRALGRISPRGGTALYDTVVEAVPLFQSSKHRKKALVIISDGNDTSSSATPAELRRLVQESEVLVYAVGIDGHGEPTATTRPRYPTPGRGPVSGPFPIPGRGPSSFPPPRFPIPTQPGGGTPGGPYGGVPNDRVNVSALRALTDESGGRTEVIRDARDLDPATASIADELSQQYYLAYAAPGPRDGQWHAIDVSVAGRRGVYVRHRRGYVAGP